jgi:hypothetical protein
MVPWVYLSVLLALLPRQGPPAPSLSGCSAMKQLAPEPGKPLLSPPGDY